jgi:putative ABC transport system permease protein
MDNVLQDLKYAVRQLRNSPGYIVAALLTLAFGLGATTAIFSIVDGVLLRPLSFREPERLFVAENIPRPGEGLARGLPVNARQFHEWRANCRSCEDVAIFQGLNLTLVGIGEPVRLFGLEVSYNFFRALGVRPVLGRDFSPEDEGNFGIVILSDRLWRTRFNRDPSIIGRPLQINGEAHVVAGILPRNLYLPRGDQWGAFTGSKTDPLIFRPLMRNPLRDHPTRGFLYSSVVRLKAAAGAGQGTSELNALLAAFRREHGLQTRIALTPLHQQVVRQDREPLLLLLGAVGAVLLIVCVNIGNLMLVRTASRFREAGIRLALGASRSRVFALILTEALLLVTAGALAGLLLAYGALRVFVTEAPLVIARLDEVQIDWRVAIFAVALAALSAIVCGSVPAWRLAKIPPLACLKAGTYDAGEGRSRLRWRDLVVSLEVALSTVLLAVGALLMLSFFRLLSVHLGFEPARVIAQDVSFLSPKYGRGVRRGFTIETVGKLAVLPGVDAAAAINKVPLTGEESAGPLRDAVTLEEPSRNYPTASFRFITPDYFKVMGISLRQGRYLEDADRDRPVAVISEQAARMLWGNANPLGRSVQGAGPSKPALAVVGVVGEVRSKLEDPPGIMVYEHFWRMQPIAMTFVLRTPENPAPVAAAVRTTLASADPEMAISPARTMQQIIEESTSARRFQTLLAAVFAGSALGLASLGIYGVISFSVARRTPEIGIRIALGATRRRLFAMVIKQGMIPVLAGLCLGLVGALWAGRLIANQLFGVGPHDPSAILGAVVLLVSVALFACWIPARRAMRIDPISALRFE